LLKALYFYFKIDDFIVLSQNLLFGSNGPFPDFEDLQDFS